MNSILKKNKDYSEKIFQDINHFKIPKEIKEIIIKNKIKTLIDLGCGDGAFLIAIKKEFPKIEISGVDISPRRINDLKKRLGKENLYCLDVCHLNLKEKFDLVYSSQVIEHVPSDKKMILEIDNLLKKDGILIISSVIKKKFAIYKYRNHGKFVLDPTHEREYKNKEEFINLFSESFNLIDCKVIAVKRKFLDLKLKIPGYFLIECIFTKKNNT